MNYRYLEILSDKQDTSICHRWLFECILSAIKFVYPDSIIQRCLVYIQRQVINYISNHLKSEVGVSLFHILNYPPLSNPLLFQKLFEKWKEKYLPYLTEKSISGKGGCIFTHSSLSKAMKHIDNTLYHTCFRVINILIATSKDQRTNWNDTSEFLPMNELMNTNDYRNVDYILL